MGRIIIGAVLSEQGKFVIPVESGTDFAMPAQQFAQNTVNLCMSATDKAQLPPMTHANTVLEKGAFFIIFFADDAQASINAILTIWRTMPYTKKMAIWSSTDGQPINPSVFAWPDPDEQKKQFEDVSEGRDTTMAHIRLKMGLRNLLQTRSL